MWPIIIPPPTLQSLWRALYVKIKCLGNWRRDSQLFKEKPFLLITPQANLSPTLLSNSPWWGQFYALNQMRASEAETYFHRSGSAWLIYCGTGDRTERSEWEPLKRRYMMVKWNSRTLPYRSTLCVAGALRLSSVNKRKLIKCRVVGLAPWKEYTI